MKNKEKIFAVAPMMDWTDRHCRYFHRQLSKNAQLYTEMVTAAAIRFGDRDRLLGFSILEQPVVLQLGGSDPAALGEAARIGEDYGYSEINLNVGCPSDRVQKGSFGACLMAEPDLVGECVAAMRAAVKIPVTVKCRIGIDDQDIEEPLSQFVTKVSQAGCQNFIVHARKAWLHGLSPKQNRDIPPLDYQRVIRLKQEFPHLHIIINGGLKTLSEAEILLPHLDGVMFGRAAYHDPWILADVDRDIFSQENRVQNRFEAALSMADYVADQLARGVWLSHITRHMLGLFHAQPGGRIWRHILTVNSHQPGADFDVVIRALAEVKKQQESREDYFWAQASGEQVGTI